MNTEKIDGFDIRLARHAALADAVRLRIVDLLTLGDYSPSELHAELGIPSNLLSHHLRTLESAGLVLRHRSEADKRRSYISLRPGSLTELTPGVEHVVRRVLFVCTHNSARSQLATALWGQASDIPAASAGTHPAAQVAPGAVDIAARHGLDLSGLTPRHLNDVGTDDAFVVTVCDNAHEELLTLPGIHWSIPDPIRSNTLAAFERTYEDITRRINDLAPKLHAA
ncbi:helix-turn-helix domain-containing protein [Paenarthrobacter sp. NPDC089316]|uniref:arsenate reductase/protein-tyrosine-phosphatase family protein n=1 Tax=unclassified Paenarthrobacter TaxID=2634190 RepID=UPI0034358F10